MASGGLWLCFLIVEVAGADVGLAEQSSPGMESLVEQGAGEWLSWGNWEYGRAPHARLASILGL